VDWMRSRLREGMRYTLAQVSGRNVGMIEYLPAENAWRGVDADGYMCIHCFWVTSQNRRHGYGRQLLESCMQDSKGMHGVVVLSSRFHWLPTRKIFLKNGFEVADEHPPFELLVRRFDPQAPLPSIRRNNSTAPPGLSLYYSDQCPYMQNMPGIVQRVGDQLDIPVTLVHLENAFQAQESPCSYGVLGIFYNGEQLEYRPVGTEKLVELVRKSMEPIQ